MSRNYPDKVHDMLIQALAEVRQSKGISHQKLAEKIGVSRPAISYVESGKRKPSLYLCLSIANALGITLCEVLSEIEKQAKK